MAEIARDGENGAQEAPVRKPRRTKTEDYQAAGQTYAPAPKKADAEREAGNARPGNPDGVRPGARPRRNGTRRTLTRPNGI